MANPGPAHIIAIRRVLRYLAGTKHMVIIYRCAHTWRHQLYVTADADHVGAAEADHVEFEWMGSHAGRSHDIVGVQGSRRQAVTAISSTESELYSVLLCGLDCVYLRRMMDMMDYKQSGAGQQRMHLPVQHSRDLVLWCIVRRPSYNQYQLSVVWICLLCDFTRTRTQWIPRSETWWNCCCLTILLKKNCQAQGVSLDTRHTAISSIGSSFIQWKRYIVQPLTFFHYATKSDSSRHWHAFLHRHRHRQTQMDTQTHMHTRTHYWIR